MSDGLLSDEAVKVVEAYATTWVTTNARDLDAERAHPELDDEFLAVRCDPDFALAWRKSSAPKRTAFVVKG